MYKKLRFIFFCAYALLNSAASAGGIASTGKQVLYYLLDTPLEHIARNERRFPWPKRRRFAPLLDSIDEQRKFTDTYIPDLSWLNELYKQDPDDDLAAT